MDVYSKATRQNRNIALSLQFSAKYATIVTIQMFFDGTLLRKDCNQMFSVGDKIVYPMHGAGVIEELEHLEVDGCNHLYYVMVIPTGNLKIRVSAQKAATIGIRGVYSKDEVLSRVSSVVSIPMSMPENWNQRYKENLERIKTGNLDEVTLVFRNLLHRERSKGLSSVEKKMLQTAKQIILSEIVLSQNVEKDHAEQLLETILQ